MGYSHIEIKTADKAPSVFTEIFFDGHKLHGVRSYELKQVAGEMPVLTVDLNAVDLDIEQTVETYQLGRSKIKSITFDNDPPQGTAQ